MSQTKVVTGAIALIKVNGIVVGKMKTVRATENIRRVPVRGIGTILPSEQAAVEWEGSLSCESMLMSFKNGSIPNAIRRIFPNVASQVLTGDESFEDQLVLDSDGVQLDLFEKVTDVIDPVTGIIKPKLEPIAIIRNCLIESDTLDISEGTISGNSQSFKYLKPITYTT